MPIPRQPVMDGRSIDQFIPKHLRDMFYRHPMPQYKYAIHAGYAPYSFPTKGLVLYLPPFASKNSKFKSVDAYEHTCTRVGAGWTPNSWTLDGVNDRIAVAHHAAFSFIKTNPFTLISWAKCSTDAPNYIMGKHNGAVGYFMQLWEGAAVGELRLHAQIQKVGHKNVYGDTDLIDGVWHCNAFTYDGSDTVGGLLLYVGGVLEGLTTGSAGIIGDMTLPDDLLIGERGDGASDYTGGLGEQWVYNRALTAAELLHTTNATKWRYP